MEAIYHVEFYKPWTYFWIIQGIGLLLLVAGLVNNFLFYTQGQRSSLERPFSWGRAGKAVIWEVILQTQIWQKSKLRWFMHAGFFWGFLGLFGLSACLFLVTKLLPPNNLLYAWLVSPAGQGMIDLWGDLGGFLLLIGLFLALGRRLVRVEKQIETDYVDSLILLLLTLLTITGFWLEAGRIALLPLEVAPRYAFFGYWLSTFFRNMSQSALLSMLSTLWSIHASLNAVLLAYFPWSKLMHTLATPAEIIFSASDTALRGDLFWYGVKSRSKI